MNTPAKQYDFKCQYGTSLYNHAHGTRAQQLFQILVHLIDGMAVQIDIRSRYMLTYIVHEAQFESCAEVSRLFLLCWNLLAIPYVCICARHEPAESTRFIWPVTSRISIESGPFFSALIHGGSVGTRRRIGEMTVDAE